MPGEPAVAHDPGDERGQPRARLRLGHAGQQSVSGGGEYLHPRRLPAELERRLALPRNVAPEVRRSALVLLFLLAAAPAQAAPTRYSPAGSCRQIAGVPTRLQATALGRYLLYRPDGTFTAARPDGSVGVDAAPSAAADWTARGAGAGSRSRRRARRSRAPVTPATGCAVYPEAELDATGTPSKGATPFGKVGGLVDGHMHWMTYEYLGGNFHCGKPWDAYGIPYALPDCAAIEGPAGAAAPFQNFLNYNSPVHPHDTRGFPQLTEWKPTNLTYEGTYWRWIQRAYLGGLRLMVMSVNENRVLCELQANHKTDCDEMETVRRGLDDIRQLQDYVDAQAGGPGKGFFQIVTTPYAARRVINAGKMAVVLEIEVSEPFGCSGWDAPTCDQAQIDAGLADLYKRGVRSALLLNKFDNPLTGVRFDSGPVGTIINGGNLVSAGSFWSAQTCTGPLHDNTIATASPVQTGAVGGLLGGLGVQAPPLPVYPPAPHCNTRGLTALGAHTVEQMMDRHMIVNPDHMSQAGVDATLSLLEARHYSGVISPHGWMDPGNWPRIWKLGGLAWPGHSDAAELRQGVAAAAAAADAVRVRLGLRRGPRRALGAADRHGGAHLPVQEHRRQGHVPAPEDRRPDVRLPHRGRRPLRPLRRLVRRPAPPRRRAAGQGPVERRRGLPGDVGARRRHRRVGLHAGPAAAAGRELDRAAAPRRPAADALARVDVVRAGRRRRRRRARPAAGTWR